MKRRSKKQAMRYLRSKVLKQKFISAHSAVVKERLSKRYRIPELDVKITKQRILQESRCMEKCKKAGIVAPRLG